jgi:hypothetical protein
LLNSVSLVDSRRQAKVQDLNAAALALLPQIARLYVAVDLASRMRGGQSLLAILANCNRQPAATGKSRSRTTPAWTAEDDDRDLTDKVARASAETPTKPFPEPYGKH